MLELFKPDIYQKNILDINYKKIKNMGVKCIAFDLDNTLVGPSSITIAKDKIKLIKELKKDFKVVIISNSLKSRVKKIGEQLKIEYYAFSIKPIQRNYRKMKSDLKLKDKEILTVGDQLLTDVLGAKRAKFLSALVTPMNKKEFFISKFNRIIEHFIFKRLKKKYNITKGEYFEWKDVLAVVLFFKQMIKIN